MSQGFNKKWRMRWGCGRTPLRRGYLLPCVAWGITNGSSHPCVDESVADLLRRGALRHGTRTQPWGVAGNAVRRGIGTGNPVSIPIHGTVLAQGIQPIGVYEDVVTVTVTY